MRVLLLWAALVPFVGPASAPGQEAATTSPEGDDEKSAEAGPVAVPPATDKAMRYSRTGNMPWRAGHPPSGDPIDFANAYRPWERGAAPRYEKLFRAADVT